MEKIAEKIIKNNKKNDKFKQNINVRFLEKQSYEIYHEQKKKLMQIQLL